jgi:hypothetical protein
VKIIHSKTYVVRNKKLHKLATDWLAGRAIPERDGGLGVFADTWFCSDLERLLATIDRAAFKRGQSSVWKSR